MSSRNVNAGKTLSRNTLIGLGASVVLASIKLAAGVVWTLERAHRGCG